LETSYDFNIDITSQTYLDLAIGYLASSPDLDLCFTLRISPDKRTRETQSCRSFRYDDRGIGGHPGHNSLR
jgi:hypothetical protein